MPAEHKSVFISHAHVDKRIAAAFCRLMHNGLDVPMRTIFCTSQGASISLGEDIVEQMKFALQAPERPFVVILLSQDYYKSPHCMAEMGATWALDLPFAVLVRDQGQESDVKGVFKDRLNAWPGTAKVVEDFKQTFQQHYKGPLNDSGWPEARGKFLTEFRRSTKVEPSIPQAGGFHTAEQSLVKTPHLRTNVGCLLESIALAASDLHVYPAFLTGVLEEINLWRYKADRWTEGQFTTRTDSYAGVLVQMYRNAEKSVFSTVIPNYLSAWNGGLGEKILTAHKESKASVIRIFIFKREEEVTEDVLRIMQGLCAVRCEVRILLTDNCPEPYLATAMEDFTLIDDKVLGLTQFNDYGVRADWHFDDKPRLEEYRLKWDGLFNFSEELRKWRSRRAK
jgi:hypothetical protein